MKRRKFTFVMIAVIIAEIIIKYIYPDIYDWPDGDGWHNFIVVLLISSIGLAYAYRPNWFTSAQPQNKSPTITTQQPHGHSVDEPGLD